MMGIGAEPLNDHHLVALFNPLYQRFEQPVAAGKLLAHYTSIRVMESILQTSEVWFSNPLFVNDMQEMRSGLQEGTRFFSNKQPLIKAGGGSMKRADILQQLYFHYFRHFDEQQAFDTYVFCLPNTIPMMMMVCFRCGGVTVSMGMAPLSYSILQS